METILNLQEVIADIAINIPNELKELEHDSRFLTKEIVGWGEEFCSMNQTNDWQESDYLLEVDAFAERKFKEFLKQLKE